MNHATPHYITNLLRVVEVKSEYDYLNIYYTTIDGRDDSRVSNYRFYKDNSNLPVASKMKAGRCYVLRIRLFNGTTDFLTAREVELVS